MRNLLITLFCMCALTIQGNPVDDLIERVAPGASRHFKTVLQPSERDFFELSQQGKRVCIKGNSWVNIASGLNWYLKYYAGIHLTWNNMKVKAPVTWPTVPKVERRETDLTWRYNFNYCTFSYSMAFWDWERWEQEIDWMALHGVNMPLAVVGAEVAWRNMLMKLGYSKDEVNKFIAGPAFLAWWEMNNLEGWGGPLPDAWYAQQEALQKRILKREKELGMSPVLPGYCGMMPHDAKAKLGLDVTDGGTWNGYTRPANLSATDPKFDHIADLYYRELTRLYGKADYYSMDPFHESPDDASVDYAEAGRKLLAAMKRANGKSNWVIQGWMENPRPQMIEALPEGDIIILDLFSECRPMFGAPSIWQRKEGYGRHNWLFCMLENFGANVGLHGRMDQLVHNFKLAASPSTPYQNARKHLKGIGFTMEGSENNPIMFELMSELVWRANDLVSAERDRRDFKEGWTRNYVKARYGIDNPKIQEAWQLLIGSIYNCPVGNNQQGPHESIFNGRPSLDNFQVKSWSKMRNYYDPNVTLRAAQLMTSVADRYRGNNNFEYDLVDIVRQAMDDQARLQYLRTIADYKGFDRTAFSADSARFLNMLLLQDKLLGTRQEFRLGTRIEQARSLSTTLEEKNLYEWNARVQITTWGNRTCANEGGLRDYAHKEWQGLLRDFYFMRWHTYLDALSKQMTAHAQPDFDALGAGSYAGKTADELYELALPAAPQIDWYALEEPWTKQHNVYTSAPEGNSVDVAKEVMRFLSQSRSCLLDVK
ncbi:alpha-N-acetylglucosaminidase [Hallella bergensis]|nr:alpha-N-acetylglucosaminidase [Hallella bergensis]